MVIDLNYARTRATFLALVLLSATALSFFSGKAFLASCWNASSNPELWRRAARLEPGNAEYWRHAGLFRQWELSPEGTSEAIRDLEIATRVNPRSPELWMELADAYQSLGDPIKAQKAYQEAQTSYPASAEVAWRFGSFLLYQGKTPDGYKEIRRALLLNPSLAPSAISECWQSDPNVDSLINHVLPAEHRYFHDAIGFFLSQHLGDAALAVWNRQEPLGLPLTMADAVPLIDELIDTNHTIEASKIWKQALEDTKWPQSPVHDGSLVFNGGFEHAIANGGYDWREETVSGAHFDFDNVTAHSGSRSLQVQFDGEANLDFRHLFQYLPVEPDTRYQFSAYVRTAAISTDRGICFEISDPLHPSELQVLTSEMSGSNPWTRVQAEITTAHDTRLIKLTLRRVASWKFDNKLSGAVWVDDITLTHGRPASENVAR